MILTTEEILSLDHRGSKDEALRYARVVEAKILEKQKAQATPRSYLYKHRWFDGSDVWSHKDTLNGTPATESIPLFEHPSPSITEGWQQFTHTLKYLIQTWREGKETYPQESGKYDENITAAHLLLKAAEFNQGRYFPVLAAAPKVKP